MSLVFGVITDLHFGPEGRHEGKLRKLTAHAGEDFREKIGVLSGQLAFAGNALFCGMAFENAERQFAHGREIPGRVPLLDATFIFTEMDIQMPVQIVFNAPMTPQAFRGFACSQTPAGDEVLDFLGGLAFA